MNWQSEYNRGFQDGLKNCGYDDGAINTKGDLIDFRLAFRKYADAYAQGYQDGFAYRGEYVELVHQTRRLGQIGAPAHRETLASKNKESTK
jgi:hypothetical protein